MDSNNKQSSENLAEPATVPGPASYEEELKDYSKDSDEGLIDNMPDSHPEPKPTQESR